MPGQRNRQSFGDIAVTEALKHLSPGTVIYRYDKTTDRAIINFNLQSLPLQSMFQMWYHRNDTLLKTRTLYCSKIRKRN